MNPKRASFVKLKLGFPTGIQQGGYIFTQNSPVIRISIKVLLYANVEVIVKLIKK
jgi:hypothetical protein